MKVLERITKAFFKQYQLNQINIMKSGSHYLLETGFNFNAENWKPHQDKSVGAAMEDLANFLYHFPLDLVVESTLSELDIEFSNAGIYKGKSIAPNNTRLAAHLNLNRSTIVHHRNADKDKGIIILDGNVYIKKRKLQWKE